MSGQTQGKNVNLIWVAINLDQKSHCKSQLLLRILEAVSTKGYNYPSGIMPPSQANHDLVFGGALVQHFQGGLLVYVDNDPAPPPPPPSPTEEPNDRGKGLEEKV